MRREVMTVLAVAILAIAGVCVAQDLSLSITGPSTAAPGKLVTLTAGGDAEHVVWHVEGLEPDDWQSVETTGSRRMFVVLPDPGGTPRYYRFVLFGARTKEGQVEVGKAVFVVLCQPRGPLPPPPGPTPGPNPPIPVPPPAPTLGLAEWSVANKALVSPEARGTAQAMSAAFRQASEDRSLSSVADLQQRTRELTKVAKGAYDTQWRPWFQVLEQKLVSLKLGTLDEHRAAWRELSEGFLQW